MQISMPKPAASEVVGTSATEDTYMTRMYIVPCEKVNCQAWAATHPQIPAPSRHWHCTHDKCPSLGLLSEGTPWSGATPYNAKRHCTAHDRQHDKTMQLVQELWSHLTLTSAELNRTEKIKNMTEYRLGINSAALQVAESTDWSTRLYIGKTGPTGELLVSALQRYTHTWDASRLYMLVANHTKLNLPIAGSAHNPPTK